MSKSGKTLEAVKKIQSERDPDPSHSTQVALLALCLFDELKSLHKYGKGERLLLQISALLHDIGWSEATPAINKHHKLSGELIRSLTIPGLNKKDALVCSLIARYHTKALPDASRHNRFSKLSKKNKEIVEWLAGMLRVADGLDCRHLRNIGGLKCDAKGSVINIKLEKVTVDCQIEMVRAARKHDLLCKVTGKKIEYSH